LSTLRTQPWSCCNATSPEKLVRDGRRSARMPIGRVGGGRNERLPLSLPHMVHETREQLMVRRAALMGVGRALRHELDCEQPDRLPEHIRKLLARLEREEK